MAPNGLEGFVTRDKRCLSFRHATEADHDAVASLLSESNLPMDGVEEWLQVFWVAEHAGRVVGVAGLERYGDGGLLRSVAVAPAWRGSGVGRALVDRVLDEGHTAGVRDVYLLTTTAEHYFPRLGFACVSRESVPAEVRASAEFTGACPASAVVMRKVDESGANAGQER